jgi:hypothetical protein
LYDPTFDYSIELPPVTDEAKRNQYGIVPSGKTLIKNLTLAEGNRYIEAINGARKMRLESYIRQELYARNMPELRKNARKSYWA